MQGFLLALTTAFFWGALPIALKQVTTLIDPLTIVWLRFTSAALWQWGLVMSKPTFPRFSDWSEIRTILLFTVAALGLGGNFVGYNTSVMYLSASAAQIVAQAGPLLLMLGSVVVLREQMHKVQIVGGFVLVLGLTLFFNDRLHEILIPRQGYGLGIIIGLAATAVWSMYGLAQKVLLRDFSPAHILRIVYTGVAIGLFPFTNLGNLCSISAVQLVCLAFCCINTIVAYGCFGKAMQVWHMAGVGAIVSLPPLITLLCTKVAHTILPQYFPNEELNCVSYAGACTVVFGAILLAVGPHLLQRLHARKTALSGTTRQGRTIPRQ